MGLKDLRLQGISLAMKWIARSTKENEPYKVPIRHNIERGVPCIGKSWKVMHIQNLLLGKWKIKF